ncbi:MAG: hypothetical protein ACO3DQ_06315, partial [Cephaloticoccus sp.]
AAPIECEVFHTDIVEASRPVPVEARFQVYQEDGCGSVSATGAQFTITRPGATLFARAGGQGVAVDTGKLPLAEQDGVQPFGRVASAAALKHDFVTVCTAAKKGTGHGDIAIAPADGGWRITGAHGDQRIDVVLADAVVIGA